MTLFTRVFLAATVIMAMLCAGGWISDEPFSWITFIKSVPFLGMWGLVRYTMRVHSLILRDLIEEHLGLVELPRN